MIVTKKKRKSKEQLYNSLLCIVRQIVRTMNKKKFSHVLIEESDKGIPVLPEVTRDYISELHATTRNHQLSAVCSIFKYTTNPVCRTRREGSHNVFTILSVSAF